MIYSVAVSLLVLVSFCDSQGFDASVPQGDTVWANNSGVALFAWRYIPRSADATTTINCYYEETRDETDVIVKKNNNNPEVSNDIQNTLRGRLEAHLDPNDRTIFGFKITRTSKSDPKVYQCLAIYSVPGSPTPNLGKDFSKKLSLEVLDPPDLSQCLNNIQPAKYDSTLTVKCFAPGNPPPDVTCQLWDENDDVLRSLASQPVNFTEDVRIEGALVKLRKIVCFITARRTGSYNETTRRDQVLVLRPPFPPKNLTQLLPEGALATSIHLQWADIPVEEQGGDLRHYNITYWVKGQIRHINKTDLSIGKPQSRDGFISYEIQGLQTGLEYQVDVYGVNQYSTDAINEEYYVSRITATPKLPPTPASSTSNKNTGAIIGGVIGGVVFVIIVIILVVYCTRRDDRQKHFPTSYVDDVVDYPPAQGAHQLYSTVEKKRLPSHDDDSTSGYPDIISTTQNGDYGNQMRSKSSSSFEPSSKVYL